MAWPTLTDALMTTEVRTLLGEPTARRVSDAEIVRWIDKGMQTICHLNKAYATTANFALTENQIAYTTGTTGMTDVVAVRGVIYTASTSATTPTTNAKALQRMHPRHYSHIQASTADLPKEWHWFNETLYVWPLPSATAATKKLQVFYWKVDTDLSGSNEFQNIPYHYQPWLIWYAYSQALLKIGKPQQAMQYMSYFDIALAHHRMSDDHYDGGAPDSEDMMNLPDYTEVAGGQ